MSFRRRALLRARGQASLLLSVCLLAGCSHKRVKPLVLPQSPPVPLAPDNNPNPPVLQEPAKPKLPEVPVAAAATKPKRVKKKPAAKPSTQTASGVTLPSGVGTDGAAANGVGPFTPSAEGVSAGARNPGTEAAASNATVNREIAMIGSLSAGDQQNPHMRQEVLEMIAANERRLGSLPADTVRSQAALVGKVRTFQRDAQQALDSGDAEGARTLATKGKLLLDDLIKPAT